MGHLKRTPRIGRPFASCAALWAALAVSAVAGEVQFSASVDRGKIGADESVSLKLLVKAEGNARVSQPQFSAPDFDLVNQYVSNFIESYYENGSFGMRNSQTLTKVLRPNRQGELKISRISVSVGGKTYIAPDITVQVVAGGGGTPPPRGYGGGGIGLRGTGKSGAGKNVIIRSELDKNAAFKGEQVVVSYYLYRRIRVFNIMVEKYPILSGFLREDLEMPVLSPRLDTERVVLDGVPYDRSLLLRYAAYPLQDGKLRIDALSVKFSFFTSPSGVDDDDPILNFFQQMVTRTGTEKSEQLSVEVVPLPEDARPASFSGGVGDFSVSTAVDKYDVRANEAVTITVKVEGRGNVAAIGEPKASWPEDVELYDSKGRAKSGKAGVGEKVFEFLVIPRTPGKVKLPALEFGFFDPVKKAYYTRFTEPVELTVLDPAPGSAVPAARQRPASETDSAKKEKNEEMFGLRAPSIGSELEGDTSRSNWLFRLSWIAFGAFAILVLFEWLKSERGAARAAAERRSKAEAKSWARLRVGARSAVEGSSWQEVTHTYELLTGAVFDALDRSFQVGARSLPRTELRRVLVTERGLAEVLWVRIDRLLEFGEMVRFASSAGAVSEASARSDLSKWVNDGEAVVNALERNQRS